MVVYIMKESLCHKSTFTILKYNVDGELYSVENFEDNVMLDSGIEEIWKLLLGTSTDTFTSSTSTIGVGDGDTAEDSTQTDLVGSNKVYNGMDSGYPQLSSTTITFRSTFDGDTANQEWKEFVVKNSSSSICLNRKYEDKGEKISGETWTVIVNIQLT